VIAVLRNADAPSRSGFASTVIVRWARRSSRIQTSSGWCVRQEYRTPSTPCGST